MRLIDADILQDDGINYVYEQSINYGVIKQEYRFINRIQIDTAPTVEAIPIEWIKKYIKELDFDGLEYILESLIHDWEKENETD